MGFVGRYAVLTIAWSLPVALLMHHLAGKAASSFLGGALGSLGGTGLVALALIVLSVLLMLLSLLIATKTDTIGEALSGDSWRWVLGERRSDLVPFLSSAFGGILVFALYVWPLLIPAALVLGKASAGLGVAFSMFCYAAPGMAAPILLGRLAGAFVFGEGRIDESPQAAPGPQRPGGAGLRSSVAPVLTVPRATAESPGAQAVHAAKRLDVKQTLDALRLKAASNPEGALTELQILRDAHPMNAIVAVELASLLQRNGKETEALTAAAVAIKVALTGGTAPLAVDTFSQFASARERLDLDAQTLELLARQLITRKDLNNAVWCFRHMGKKGGDAMRSQKGLIAVAEAAARDGNAKGAVQIYDYILVTFPDTTLRDYVETAKNELLLRSAG